MEINHFKRFNQRFGVRDGDQILLQTYLTLREHIHAGELLARTSDDHFFLLLRCGREETKSLEDKVNYLKKEFHKLGITAHFSSIKWDYWQAVLSRGDDSFTDFLIDVYKKGGKIGAFKSAAKLHNINTDYYAYNDFNLEDTLPWDFIELRPGKDFLIKEHNRLLYNN